MEKQCREFKNATRKTDLRGNWCDSFALSRAEWNADSAFLLDGHAVARPLAVTK